MNKMKGSVILISVAMATIIPTLTKEENLEGFKKNITKENTKASVEIYNELSNIEKEEGQKIFVSYIKNLNDNVEVGIENPKIAMEKLNDIKDIKEVTREVNDAKESIINLEKSQIAFKRGERAEIEEDYKLALENYNSVIKEDKINYLIAKDKIKRIKNLLED